MMQHDEGTHMLLYRERPWVEMYAKDCPLWYYSGQGAAYWKGDEDGDDLTDR